MSGEPIHMDDSHTVGERQTTYSLRELLRRETVRQTLPFLQSRSCGKVRVEAVLRCGGLECSAEIRIGTGKMYVLQDIFGFVRAVRGQENRTYGKSLEFVHAMESFEEASRPLVSFLLQWAERYGRRYAQSGEFGYHDNAAPRLRALTLDGWGLDALLDALEGRRFTVETGEDCRGGWRVTEEALAPELFLEGTDGGVELRLSQPLGYRCERDYVYFREGKVYRLSHEALGTAGEFMECMRFLPGRKAFLAERDWPAFCRRMLPALREHFQCHFSGVEEQTQQEEAVIRFYLDLPQRELVTCRAVALYGDREYSIFDHAEDLGLRDLARETEAAALLGDYCSDCEEAQERMLISRDEELFYRLLTEGIGRLQQLGEVYISDALKKVRVLPPPRAEVGISLGGDLLQLSVTSEDMPGEKLAEILSRYDRRRKFYRLRDGSFIRMEGGGLEALWEMSRVLHLTDRQLAAERIEVPRYRLLYLDEQLEEGHGLSVTKDAAFRELAHRLRTVEESGFEVPDSLRDVMRDYQKYGCRWLRTLCRNGLGGILADDMGLGKTLQVISFLLAERRGISLIVCPASLVYNWKRELERFAPKLRACMVTGTAQQRRELLEQPGDREVFITSYDLLRRDIGYYEKLPFFCQVIDEAQYIKNHGTQAARAVKRVRAEFKLALTGTPIENRLSELWSIFDYLMPGYLYSYQRFRTELEQPIVQQSDEEAAGRLQKLIRPFVLRRLKKDVLQELPDKLEENLYAVMEGEQQELYDAHLRRLALMLEDKTEAEFRAGKLQILAELTRLRQLCCDPALLYENYRGESAKKEMALHLIRNAVENGHKVLLFSQFTTMLERLAEMLDREGIAYHMLTGATSRERRAAMVEAFAGDNVPVFCISLKAGGTGLNLTAADVVIHFDPWWNVAAQNQATDRAHRIGQTSVVNVWRLIARGTIEEKIVELQQRKLALADSVLGGSTAGSGSLTREELLELLRPGRF
ncbi:MAG: DEAD/DEAH box helicase [Eubacteriales bacterium]|nr:DEAD/DEAH box helicase [Eubacteriales bacterium]